jgi:hypothetical protein
MIAERKMKRHVRTIIHAVREAVGKPLSGVEVGVWRGEASEQLLDAFPMLTLWMVDPYPPTPTMNNDVDEIAAAEAEARLRTDRFVWRRELVRIPSCEAAGLCSLESKDFIFIDACHLYESVREDTELWWPALLPGGLMLWHDYGGAMDRRGKWGVKRAVDEFCESLGIDVRHQGITAWARKGEAAKW